MAKAFAGDSFPDYYVATVAESYTGYVTAYGDQYSVNIKDTNGQVWNFLMLQEIFLQ